MKYLKKILANPKGMTLIEVLVALAVISILAITALKASTQGLTVNAEAGKQSVAINLAQDKIDEIKLQPWASMSSVTSPTLLATLNNQEYFYTANVQDVEANKLRRITVKVIWNTSVERQVYLSTLIAKQD